METHQNLSQKKNELIDVGLSVSKYGFWVKPIRRILWPFIRAYHYYHLEHEILVDSKLQHTTQSLIEHETLVDSKLQHTTQALARLISEITLLRSEIASLKNNYVTLDSLLGNEVANIRNEVVGIRNEVANIRNEVGQQKARGLKLVNTEYGLFIGKNGDFISENIFKGNLWDSHIIQIAHEVSTTRSSGKAIDVGGHFGSITLPLASIFNEVFSFEPNDFNFRILQGNIAINKLSNVHLFNSCLYSHLTTLSLARQEKQEIDLPINNQGEFDGDLAYNLGAYLFGESESGLFEHSAKTLDSYDLDNVAFIKIDVQGADGEVLLGAIQTIKRCSPVIVFEWEEHLSKNFSVTFDSLVSELTSLGYEISQLKVHNEKQVDYIARPIQS